MKKFKRPWGLAAALALCLPGFGLGAPAGQMEQIHAEASWMDGVGKPAGSAVVLAGAAAPAPGLEAPRLAKGSPPRNLGGGSRRSAYGRGFGAVMSPAADIFEALDTDNPFYGIPAILAGVVVGAALLGPAVAVGILAALTNPLFKWTNAASPADPHEV